MAVTALTALALTIVIAITPALLFLGFWRLLVSMRDDALIEELYVRHDLDVASGLGVPVRSGVLGGSRDRPSTDRCPRCGSVRSTHRSRCSCCEPPVGR